jgi:hypothetical protein
MAVTNISIAAGNYNTYSASWTNPTEARPGVGSRSVPAQAAIGPPGAPVVFTMDNARATFSPIQADPQFPILSVDGVSLSANNQDTHFLATFDGHTCASLPVTVVEPRHFAQTSPVVDDTPVIDPDNPSVVLWQMDVTVTIKDQFSVELGAHWNGLPFVESVNGGAWTGFSEGAASTPLNGSRFTDESKFRFTANNPTLALKYVNCTKPLPFVTGGGNLTQVIAAVMDNGTTNQLVETCTRTVTVVGATKTATTVNVVQ